MVSELRELSYKDVEPAAEMLARAFDGDPLMRAFFSRSLIPAEQSRQELFRYSCLVRLHLDWPLIGLVEDGRICGVACLSYPERPDWPDELNDILNQFRRNIGSASASVLDAYAGLVDKHRPSEVHHFLAVLGVDPRDHGRGFGRMLLEDVQHRAARHPTSIGVALDTENPHNVPFYQHFGYRMTAESALRTTKLYHFFRPSSLDRT